MIEIYNDFELIGLAPVYSQFVWTRRFGRAGEFQLETHFTKELFDILAEGNIIYKRDVDEAAIIEQRKVIQTAQDELKMVVSGRHIESILSRRIFSFEGEIELSELLVHIIRGNFLAEAGENRSMERDGLRFLGGSLPNTMISAEYRNHNAYDAIVSLCEEHAVGLKMRYNIARRTFDLEFTRPTETDVVFSKMFANIMEQNYMSDSSNMRNVVYIDNLFVHNDTTFRGINRREMSISAPREGQTHFAQSALDALHENRKVQQLSSTVNPYSEQFIYLVDWDLGSIVLSNNVVLGVSRLETITEIAEIYGEEGLSLVVNLG